MDENVNKQNPRYSNQQAAPFLCQLANVQHFIAQVSIFMLSCIIKCAMDLEPHERARIVSPLRSRSHRNDLFSTVHQFLIETKSFISKKWRIESIGNEAHANEQKGFI